MKISNKEINAVIFVPAYSIYLNKISSLECNGIIIDLEDSVSLTDKDKALDNCINFFENNEINKNVYIRINSERAAYEIEKIQRYNVAGFVIPKIEHRSDIPECCEKEVIGLVETPRGILNIKDIVSDSRVCGIAFGAEDYSAIVGCENEENSLLYAKSKIVTYCNAYNICSLDTVYTDVHNDTEFRKAVEYSKKMGFDGKMLIHPKQIHIFRDVYESVDHTQMEHIIKLFNESKTGVLQIDDKIYERPHIDRFKKILNEYYERKTNG